MKLTPIDGGRGTKLAVDTAKDLRELADLIESGRAHNLVLIAECEGNYLLQTSASEFACVAMTAMLHDWALRKARP